MKPFQKHGKARKPTGVARSRNRASSPSSDQRSVSPQVDESPVLVGRHPVREALRAGRAIDRLWIQEGLADGSLREIKALARERRIVTSEVPKSFLDRAAGAVPHQGVGAKVALKPPASLDDLLDWIHASANPLVYILDGIQDPHNLGAILRTADAVGASVVIPERGAVGLTGVVAKASAGAMEYVLVARVTNVAQAIDKIKRAGVFVFAADPTARTLYTDVDWTGPVAIVIGSEGRGVRELVRERSDGLVRLPMVGKIASINASNAAAVIGFEVIRQRQRKNSILTRL